MVGITVDFESLRTHDVCPLCLAPYARGAFVLSEYIPVVLLCDRCLRLAIILKNIDIGISKLRLNVLLSRSHSVYLPCSFVCCRPTSYRNK
jgi:hypothetical protein